MADALAQRGLDGGVHSPEDPRTVLQEALQQSGQGTPRYRVVSRTGPPHDPIWTLEVLAGEAALGQGSGRGKQDAARAAARIALASIDEGVALS